MGAAAGAEGSWPVAVTFPPIMLVMSLPWEIPSVIWVVPLITSGSSLALLPSLYRVILSTLERGHILGNGGQGIHDHLNNSRLAVFLHGLSFLINALYPCQRLGLDGRGLTYSGDTGYFLLLGKLVCCQLETAVYMMYNYYVNLLERIW